MNSIERLCRFAATLLLAIPASTVTAQTATYPSRPVTMVVGYQAGGGTDLTARIVAEKLSKALGQQFNVDNRPGAGSNIAGSAVAKAPPDGYTLFAAAGGIAVNATLYKNMLYDPQKELTPVALLTILPNVLLVHAPLPISNVAELITYAKNNPSKTSCGSSGIGSTGHLSCELFNQRAGTKILHVPYKGSAGAVLALVSGEVQVVFDQIPTPLPHVRSGKLRALALTGPDGNANLPGVPSVDAAGLAGFYANTWVGLYAPAGTPASVIDRLNVEIAKILQLAEVRDRFAVMGMDAGGGSPDRLRQLLAADIEKWAGVIKSAGIESQ